MTKLAIYEKNEGKEDIKMSKFYKTDFVRYHLLKTIVSVSVAFIIIILMIGMYHSEYIIGNAVNLDYKTIGFSVLGLYVLVLAVYIVGTIVAYSIKYELSRERLGKYFKRLKGLEKLYPEEKGENS